MEIRKEDMDSFMGELNDSPLVDDFEVFEEKCPIVAKYLNLWLKEV